MPVVTVNQLNNYMKRYIDQNSNLSDLWVKGEVSNFKQHYSGHIYLTLKDESSSVKAVIFKLNASALKFEVCDGMKIIAYGKVGVYEPAGTYQLYIETVIPDGKGELYAAYEQLKLKLTDEGLFDEKRKRTIPRFPKKIGVVTSISGAAIKDIVNVVSRRTKNVNLIIYPSKVQGIGASESICSGIKYFSDNKNVDIIIVARGGGGIEDLWAFNEEKTARTIFESKIPVISGVGHETDFTISDFVADMRAPTPSAAAELATPSDEELKLLFDAQKIFLTNKIDRIFADRKNICDKFTAENIYSMWINFYDKIEYKTEKTTRRITDLFDDNYLILSNKLTKISTMLEELNPLRILRRGYTFTENSKGKLVDFNSISAGDEINVVFDGGKLECVVRRVICNDKK